MTAHTTRLLITLRQPVHDKVELVITPPDGATVVYPLTLDQLKLLAAQSVRAVCNWPTVERLKRTIDLRDDTPRDYDEEREHGWACGGR